MADTNGDRSGGAVIPLRERRSHARLHVSAEIEVAGPRERGRAKVRDLSLGGARFAVPRPIANVGESVELVFPARGGRALRVMASVLRVERHAEEQVFAVKFVHLVPSQREAVLDVLHTMLDGRGGGQRRHPRLAHRLDVRYQTLTELHGMLRDISRGGFAMTVDEPLGKGQEVVLTIPDSAGEDLLNLRARVVHIRASAWGPSGCRVGLVFTEMSPERKRLFDALMVYLVERA